LPEQSPEDSPLKFKHRRGRKVNNMESEPLPFTADAETEIIDLFFKIPFKLMYCGERHEKRAIIDDLKAIIDKLMMYNGPKAEAYMEIVGRFLEHTRDSFEKPI
jgi:hypothetical protein